MSLKPSSQPAYRGAVAVILVACLSLVAACDRSDPATTTSSPARLAPAPKRTPGLWRQRISQAGSATVAEVSLCLDAVTDQKLAWWGQAGAVGQCQKHEVAQNPDGSWRFAAVCKGVNGTSVAVDGLVSGDFNTSYQVRATTNVKGSPDSKIAGERHFLIDALRVGPCPDGMPPGAMDIPGVGRFDSVTGHPIH